MRPMTMRRIAAVLGVVVLAGCASIPTSGPVREVGEAGGLGQSTVRYTPALPTEGASPTDVVRGYLDAMLAYPASTRTAAAFLTPRAAEDWKPQSGVTVYDGPRVALQNDAARRADGVEGESVAVTIDEVGRVRSDGRYAAGRGGRAVTYRLVQVDGEWRIDDPQRGLLVTATFFADYYRPFQVYFFDRPAERLTSVPVHLPVDDRLAAALVAILARGPGDDRLRSFVPPESELRPTVPVRDGVADVGFLSGELSDTDEERLSAQVVWTLRQVPALTGVRITVGRESVAPTGPVVQPIDGWGEYDTSGARHRVHALRGDRVVEIVGDELAPIAGPWGRDAGGAASVGVSDQDVALVSARRDQVRLAARDGAVRRTVGAVDALPPTVDADDDFWLVDRPRGETRVRLVDGAQVRTVAAPRLADLDVRAFDVSPDGARYVATVGAGRDARIVVGGIERSAKDRVLRLAAPTALHLDAKSARSAVWSDPVRIAFIGTGRTGVQVHTVLIDGSSPADAGTGGRAALPGVDARRVVTSSGDDADSYVTTADGDLWYLGPSGSWRLLDDAPVRSLGAGR